MRRPECPQSNFHQKFEYVYKKYFVDQLSGEVFICQCGCEFTVGFLENGSVDPVVWEIIEKGKYGE